MYENIRYNTTTQNVRIVCASTKMSTKIRIDGYFFFVDYRKHENRSRLKIHVLIRVKREVIDVWPNVINDPVESGYSPEETGLASCGGFFF